MFLIVHHIIISLKHDFRLFALDDNIFKFFSTHQRFLIKPPLMNSFSSSHFEHKRGRTSERHKDKAHTLFNGDNTPIRSHLPSPLFGHHSHRWLLLSLISSGSPLTGTQTHALHPTNPQAYPPISRLHSTGLQTNSLTSGLHYTGSQAHPPTSGLHTTRIQTHPPTSGLQAYPSPPVYTKPTIPPPVYTPPVYKPTLSPPVYTKLTLPRPVYTPPTYKPTLPPPVYKKSPSYSPPSYVPKPTHQAIRPRDS